ncbi:LOW QUALITY PROTEIN: interleukin-17 receptor B [Leptosomus discolor]
MAKDPYCAKSQCCCSSGLLEGEPKRLVFRIQNAHGRIMMIQRRLIKIVVVKTYTFSRHLHMSFLLLASIKELTATKTCITSKGTVEHFQCICNYWQFHYIGYPVEPETKYFVYACNLPPSKSYLLTTPGSLWTPNTTVCKTETELEVNFTTSSLGLEYLILFYECQKYEVLLKKTVEAKKQCVFITLSSFAELLHEGCQTDVILAMWEKRRIAQKGPVPSLAAQEAAADRVIFRSNATTAVCDVSCKSMRNHNNMENMFTLSVNLFCSDMTNQSSVQKHIVSFNNVSSQDT